MIIGFLNDAKLDSAVGMFSLLPLGYESLPSPLSSLDEAIRVSPSIIRSNRLTGPKSEVVIAPPALYLLLAREHLKPGLEVAAQNVFDKPNGAFTGEISVDQLKDSDITWTLIGHSERRVILQEDDNFIAAKTASALSGGIGVILCIGESLEQRERGETIKVVTHQ